MLNYYQILGVAETASEAEIKKSYQKIAAKSMTDKWKRIMLEENGWQCQNGKCGMVPNRESERYFCPDTPCRENYFKVDNKWKEVNEAYQVLSDPAKKSEYDERLPRKSQSSRSKTSYTNNSNSNYTNTRNYPSSNDYNDYLRRKQQEAEELEREAIRRVREWQQEREARQKKAEEEERERERERWFGCKK